MSRPVSPKSARIVALTTRGGPPSATYPNMIITARILGASRQAVQQALTDHTAVKGYYLMRYYDWINQPKSEETR